MVGTSRIVVLINRSSVTSMSALSHVSDIESAFGAAGVQASVDVVDPRELPATIGLWWAGQDRPDAVVVAGGDRTVSRAAGAIAGTDVVMGVLPIGTFNRFAQDLGIPTDLERAVGTLTSARVETVDVGEVNGLVFVNQVGGTLPDVAPRLESVRRWPVPPVVLSAPGGVVRRGLRASDVVVRCGRHRFTPDRIRAELSCGLLDVSVSDGDDGRIELSELTLSSSARSLRLTVDGMPTRLSTPLRIRIRPRSLRVLAPSR